MRLAIQKWGNSASVRLPAALLEQIGAAVGSALDVTVTKDGLLLKPERRPRYKLADLLAEMPGELPRAEGWDAMPTVGQEAL
ncbi:AbrB/MazE/SpoVT family DNA-binding domain-containing protein [Chromobacterium amazonense]|uniref:AbrB/MazE/SpoVT family DNA-binding domain-containing protein n=1 Tax=Chromobacterium amazonense TaxID=1382803 RepID=UPI003F7B09E5